MEVRHEELDILTSWSPKEQNTAQNSMPPFMFSLVLEYKYYALNCTFYLIVR
eukprot:m.62058 g.62058  ORF g.62058 m.62058 type:complete len:52 (+) comp8013_c0_seq5:1274-1429(+)